MSESCPSLRSDAPAVTLSGFAGGNSSPFGALRAPLSPCLGLRSELALNPVRGWVPIAPASYSETTGFTRS